MFVSVIINQQLSVQAANTIEERFKTACGGNITHHSVDKVSDDLLIKCGISRQKLLYIRKIQFHLIEYPNFILNLKNMNTAELIECLKTFKGIGEWSTQIILLSYFKKIDVFPKGDATLNRAIKILFNLDPTTSANMIDRWSPYKSIAALCLWEWIDSGMPNLN
jgi:DNA-3-methyladenine glycosylase II